MKHLKPKTSQTERFLAGLAIPPSARAHMIIQPKVHDKSMNKFLPLVMFACIASRCLAAEFSTPLIGTNTVDRTRQTVVMPKTTPDPIEPVNRAIWSFNTTLLDEVFDPAGRAYRHAVPKPARTSIGNFGWNLAFPDRVVNDLFQTKWRTAGSETERFVCNTVLGIAGFFDLASRWKIPKTDNNFSQTFADWGWQSHIYLVLPVLGPSSDRNAVGQIADGTANPIPYTSYALSAVGFNNLSENVDDLVRFGQSASDSYSMAKFGASFAIPGKKPDFEPAGARDEAALETLKVTFLSLHDREFPNRGVTQSAMIPSTGKMLKFTYWMQKTPAPIVYIVPGLGAHRLENVPLALAELAYDEGFSAVCVSSAFNPEFMENASTSALPAYAPVDAQDLHFALTQIDQRLDSLYPRRLGARVLMGFSLGAFHSLMIAAGDKTNAPALMKFDRYVAIDPPVNLVFGMTQLDKFYNAPLAWPAAVRSQTMKATYEKAFAQAKALSFAPPALNLDANESRFIIGSGFRFVLRDVIYSSQQRNNQGVLKSQLRNSRREPAYQEIVQYSFGDYIQKFVAPYYLTRGVDLTDFETAAAAEDLHFYESALKDDDNIRVIANRNDILMDTQDVNWLQRTFDPSRVTLFAQGGHGGNLDSPEVQRAIIRAIADLKPQIEGASISTSAKALFAKAP
jgi:ABC-type transporter lipoprotein component MlaA/pimeloyl-ACP methyl ester carboxylesterase